MARRYSSEYKALQPYVVEDARSVANAVLAGASGGSASGVTDHGALTGLGDDDHPQYLTPVRGDTRYIPSTRTLTAGAGLTGGGDLSADRSFAVGAGAGITVNADDVALTTPGTLTVSSTNSSTGSHTHAITASSDVGTTPAAALLKSTAGGALTLSSLAVKGSVDITNNGDLTVAGSGSYAGSNVLFADSSGGNVGILMAPDPQFALDVNGPARATYFVGPHAIQLKNVVLLSHFDGRLPYNTNYYGEPNGHMGQVATVAGGVTYRPGKFYKALQIAEAGYNYCPNPSAETNATGWTQQYNGGTLTSQARQLVTDAPYGQYAVGMTASASSSYTFNAPHFHAPDSVTMTWNNTQTATLSCYVWGAGTWRIVFEDSGQNLITYQEVTLATTQAWQRIVLTATNSSGFNYANVRLAFFPRSTNCTLFVDGVHYEANNRATPYLDGSMGDSPGHAWTGTAHASSSVRNAASLYYSQPMPTTWTVMFWAYRAAWQAGVAGYLLSWGSGSVYYNASNQDIVGPTTSTVPSTGWHHYCVIYSGDGITRAYRDGAYLGQTSAARTDATVMYVGWNGVSAQSNSLIDDLCLLERAMDVAADNSCNELRTVYESNAPVFAETSTFSFRPTPKGLIWADDEGLWMRATDGDTVLGIYGNDAQTKSWGGQTMSAGDLMIGNASAYVFWDDSAATLSVSGTVTATTGAIGGWTLGATSLTAGAGATRVGVDSGGTNPAFYAGSATPASAPFRVTNAGALTATSATITGTITASSGGISGNFYVGSDVGAAGNLYVGSNADIRMSGDGIRLVLPNTTGITIPSSSSALRWFADISATFTSAKNYVGVVGYRHTSQSVVDAVVTCYVGSTDYATYGARCVLQAGHDTGSVYTDARVEVVREAGSGAKYVGIFGDRLEVNGAIGAATMTAPGASWASGSLIYTDTADGDLKVRFANGTVKVLATN